MGVEIGPAFTIEEDRADSYRAVFLRHEAHAAIEVIVKEVQRRKRKELHLQIW